MSPRCSGSSPAAERRQDDAQAELQLHGPPPQHRPRSGRESPKRRSTATSTWRASSCPRTRRRRPCSPHLLLSGKNIPIRILSYFRGFCARDETYDTLTGNTLKSVYDIRRKLGAFGGVFAPVRARSAGCQPLPASR